MKHIAVNEKTMLNGNRILQCINAFFIVLVVVPTANGARWYDGFEGGSIVDGTPAL
ncbi:MAG: hypothetical protein KDA61_02865 [Planctomycetales bacterium]|nr:hypothetical protein [Planctomycetales bacterium]